MPATAAETVEYLTDDEQAELEAIADAFLGTVEWQFRHAEYVHGNHAKFYRTYSRVDGRGRADVQWGRIPTYTPEDRAYTTRGDHSKKPLTADEANDRWWSKLDKGYMRVYSFTFQAPAEFDYDELCRRAAAAIRNPNLRG